MTPRLPLHELDRHQIGKLAPDALVVLPMGATEQHGPHLPVGTDFLVVGRVAAEAAARAGEEIPVLVAPTLPYGSSHHHFPWGTTLSLSTDVFYRAALDLVASLSRSGFSKVFLLNGHGGNDELLQVVARDAALEHELGVAAASYWTIAWESLVAAGAASEGELPGHAGAFETSLLLAARPDLVAPERPSRSFEAEEERPYRLELHAAWEATDGYTDSPAHGHAEAGERYLGLIVDAVSRAFIDFYRGT